MSYVSAAVHEDRHVARTCDICGFTMRCLCYPRTCENQMQARHVTADMLRKHLEEHSLKDVLHYLKRVHQV